MKIEILTENTTKELIKKETSVEFRRINSYLSRLNERLLKVEDELTYKRKRIEEKERNSGEDEVR